MDKKHLEYKVELDRKGKILNKKLTDRNHVMISERDAEVNNRQTRFTKLYYVLAEKPLEKMTKKQLIDIATDKQLDVDDSMTKAQILAVLEG